MTIEPKLMTPSEITDWMAEELNSTFLAHIAAQDQRVADLELRLQIATETNVADRKLIGDLEAGIHRLHAMVDQTDPNDPIGVALTRAGLHVLPSPHHAPPP